MTIRPNLLVSFSGGQSSAYMMKRLRDDYSDRYKLYFVFANTGEENEKTLIFVQRCAKEWNIPVVWVEAVVHPALRKGTTHKVVDFATAARKGEPFEAVIKKYGIPNPSWPFCTRELKQRSIGSYMRSLKIGKYHTAIGIRADEPKRIRKDAAKARILYPMFHEFPTTKPEINDWWEEQPFRLGLLEHQGNCKWCWKKSLNKHIRIYKETPEVFEFPARMEAQYGLNGTNPLGLPRVFFRGNRSTQNIITIAQLTTPLPHVERADEDAGCSESCEVYS